MQSHTRTNFLSFILLASFIDFTNAIPQSVQGRPAVVVDRDQSAVSSTMKFVQQNLFITLFCSVVGLGLLIWFIVWYRGRNKTKEIVKTKIAEDRRRTAADVEAADNLKGRQRVMDMFIKAVGNPFGGRQRV